MENTDQATHETERMENESPAPPPQSTNDIADPAQQQEQTGSSPVEEASK